MNNPLSQYFRQPKIWVKLPTKGAYNQPGDIEMSDTHEVGVRPLSTIDNIMLRTPDALMNGEALYSVIQSCVPSIKNPRLLTQPDLHAITIGIRVASYGSTQDIKCKCPKCSNDNDISFNLTHFLDTCKAIPSSKSVLLDDNLIVYVRPFNLEQRNLELLQEFEQNKAARLINSQDDVSETDKMYEVSKHINAAALKQFETVAKSITKIHIKDTGDTVTDQHHITEFILGINLQQAQAIMEAVRELNDGGIDKNLRITCEACTHEWDQPLDFEPTSFFD